MATDINTAALANGPLTSASSKDRGVQLVDDKPTKPTDAIELKLAKSSSETDLTKSNQSATNEEVQSAVKEIETAVQRAKRELQFSVDDSSGRTVVTIVDSNTDEVIRKIPTEEVLAIARRMKDGDDSEGSLFDRMI